MFSNELSKVERALVHDLADEFGLVHRSFGKGAERYLVVSKRPRQVRQLGAGAASPGAGKSAESVEDEEERERQAAIQTLQAQYARSNRRRQAGCWSAVPPPARLLQDTVRGTGIGAGPAPLASGARRAHQPQPHHSQQTAASSSSQSGVQPLQPQEQKQKVQPQQPQQQQQRPGDWNCASCTAHNYSSRTECFRCHRPVAAAVLSPKTDSATSHQNAAPVPPAPQQAALPQGMASKGGARAFVPRSGAAKSAPAASPPAAHPAIASSQNPAMSPTAAAVIPPEAAAGHEAAASSARRNRGGRQHQQNSQGGH